MSGWAQVTCPFLSQSLWPEKGDVLIGQTCLAGLLLKQEMRGPLEMNSVQVQSLEEELGVVPLEEAWG